MDRVYLKRATISSQVICFVNTSDATPKIEGGPRWRWILVFDKHGKHRIARNSKQLRHVRKVFSLSKDDIK